MHTSSCSFVIETPILHANCGDVDPPGPVIAELDLHDATVEPCLGRLQGAQLLGQTPLKQRVLVFRTWLVQH